MNDGRLSKIPLDTNFSRSLKSPEADRAHQQQSLDEQSQNTDGAGIIT